MQARQVGIPEMRGGAAIRNAAILDVERSRPRLRL